MDVNYLAYADAVGRNNPNADGLRQMGATLEAQRERARLAPQEAQAAQLRGLQIQQAQMGVDDTQARQGSLASMGGGSLQGAYQQEQAQKQKEAKQKGFQTYLNTIGILDKMPNLDPKSKTAIGKEFLRQNPEYAPMVENLTFIDSKGVKAARQFAAGELKDPVTGQPLPAGYYETEGQWTGDAASPVKLTNYKLVPPKPDAEALLDKRFANQQALQAQQIAAQDRRTAQQIASSERKASGKPDPVDAIVAREAVKDLPKLRREARSAEASKPRIAQMVRLLDNGAGGIKGNMLASISGIFDTPATSEAELFKKLAAAGAGQLRASVIGPGTVTNYEQGLLQSVSGGGNGARTAVRQLLKYYEQEADRTILNYNDAVDSAATVAPKVVKGFGKVSGQSGGNQPPTGKPAPKLSKAAKSVADRY